MEKLGRVAAFRRMGPHRRRHPRPAGPALDFLDAPTTARQIPTAAWSHSRHPRTRREPSACSAQGSCLVDRGDHEDPSAPQLLKDVQSFIGAFDAVFGGFQERAEQTPTGVPAKLKAPAFLVVAAPPSSTRCGEASYFVARLSAETDAAGRPGPQPRPTGPRRPLSGTRLGRGGAARSNREHPPAPPALRLHAERSDTAEPGAATAQPGRCGPS